MLEKIVKYGSSRYTGKIYHWVRMIGLPEMNFKMSQRFYISGY